MFFKRQKLCLEYDMKHDDMHRDRWSVGDWTDDSDQMILILRTLLDCKGKVIFLVDSDCVTLNFSNKKPTWIILIVMQ